MDRGEGCKVSREGRMLEGDHHPCALGLIRKMYFGEVPKTGHGLQMSCVIFFYVERVEVRGNCLYH